MATIIEEIRRPGDNAPDPYRYGWRYRHYQHADGTLAFEQVPLTVEDLLHPQEGDQATHSSAHQRRRRYLVDVLESQLRHDPSAVVLEEVRIAWDTPDLGAHGPDVAVIFGVREPQTNWSTFSVAVEGVRPTIVFEITSLETATIDRSVKLEEYELAGVPLYIIVDGVSRRQNPAVRLQGFALTPTGYEMLRPDERGWLWLEPVRIWLAVAEDEVVCHDESGQPLGDYCALAATLAAERAALANERAARLAAEGTIGTLQDQLAALEDELRRLRGATVPEGESREG